MRLATLQESKLSDPDAALASIGQAIRGAIGDPQLPKLLDTYERLAGAGRGADVIALYREIGPDVMDEQVRLRLDRAVAEEARRLGQTDLAADGYRRILDRVPDDAAALVALEGIYQEAGDEPALYDILLRRAELAADEPQAEKALRARLGALAESLGRADEAIVAYERVFELTPEDRAAQVALERLYTAAERWPDLVDLIDKTLQKPPLDLSPVALRFRLAEIYSTKLADPERALGELRAVLRAEPDHKGAVAMLEAMLEDVTVQGVAAELLEPVYAGRQDWKALIHIGEIRSREVEDPAQRLALTKRIARLYEEQIEDYDSALKWYGKVFQESPTERLSLDQLLRLAARLDRWREVGALLGDYLAGALEDSPANLEIARRAAEIFDLRLDSRDEARTYYRRLFEARPDDAEIARLYEGALERWEAWQELREFLDERAGRATDVEEKKTLLRRSARIDEEMLGDIDRALQTLREVVELDPDDRAAPTAADDIRRLLAGAERWHDLADHLEAQLGRANEVAERDALALKLAELSEQKLENASVAVERYAEILERSPAHKDAIAALERLLTVPTERPRVAEILERVYRHAGNWARLVAALEARLESVDDRDDRVRLLREVADIQQRLAHVDSAFDTRARAWLVDVSNPDTLADMEALALSAKLHGPLVQTLQQGADTAGDPELQARLWAASAKVLERQLQDPGQAIEAWRHALGAQPDDAEAFDALERLLAAGNRVPELVEVLEQHLEIATDSALRLGLAKRIAALYDQTLKQRDRAIDAWRAVLEISDVDVDAMDSLGRLYIAENAWADLASILQRKVELTPDPQNMRLLRLTSARLYDERLNEPMEAISQLRAILDVVPRDPETLEFLDRLLTREAQHADLLEVLDHRAAIESNPAARDELAARAARVLADELMDLEGAIGRYRDILAHNAAHAEARAALWAIARGDDLKANAIAALEPILRAGGEWPALIDLLELKLTTEDAPANRLAILSEIARLHDGASRDPVQAFQAWARAFAEDMHDPAPRAALESLAAASGDWKSLADVYVERLDNTFDSEVQRSLAMRLGELYEGPLADAEQALEHYRKASELPGDEGPVLQSQERVLLRLGRNEDLVEVLQRQSELATDPLRQADILVHLGQVRLQSLGDVDGALSAFREALEKAPDHASAHGALRDLLEVSDAREGALDALEPLAEARGDWNELVALFEVRLSIQDDANERASWLRRIAQLYEERLDQPARRWRRSDAR